jgi:serine/threonine-protein kinase
MTRKEKFGKLVLLEESEQTGLGVEYRAAKLGPAGLEKIVTILRLKPAISGQPEVARALMEQAKLAAQLQNPNILKIFGIGKVEQSYYISYEFLEGRSLRSILDRCREEVFPFAADHALLVASKVAAALEYVHGRKNESGARCIHGLLSPSCILVSYEGEVRVKGFGYWQSRLREAGVLGEADLRWLAPEQMTGSADPRADIYSLGAVLFETLTGEPPPRGAEAASLVGSAKVKSQSGDEEGIPQPLADILVRALAADPARRYGEIQEMRKTIDTHLFSGDFTPTTFNLAFFMHSLFRDDIDREAKTVKEEREASYAEYASEEVARSSLAVPAGFVSAAPLPDTKTEPVDPRLLAAAAAAVARSEAMVSEPEFSQPEPEEPPFGGAESSAVAPPEGTPGASAKEAAAGFTFHKKEARGGRAPVLAGGALVVAFLAAGVFYVLRVSQPAAVPVPTAPPTTTLAAEVVAAQARVKELEERLASLEAEKQQAEAKAAEDAKKKVEAQAKAKGQAVDPTAMEKAQDDARQKAKAEAERKQQEEQRRLEEEKKAEEARLAEERRRAEEAATARAAQEQAARIAQEQATPRPTVEPSVTTADPPTTTLGGLRPGTLVDLGDMGVIAPVVERKPPLQYPPIALRQRAEGTVELNVLVDDKGGVTDAQILTQPGGKTGLAEAAIDNVRRWRYRPATKDGVPVKVWMTVRVRFELPK